MLAPSYPTHLSWYAQSNHSKPRSDLVLLFYHRAFAQVLCAAWHPLSTPFHLPTHPFVQTLFHSEQKLRSCYDLGQSDHTICVVLKGTLWRVAWGAISNYDRPIGINATILGDQDMVAWHKAMMTWPSATFLTSLPTICWLLVTQIKSSGFLAVPHSHQHTCWLFPLASPRSQLNKLVHFLQVTAQMSPSQKAHPNCPDDDLHHLSHTHG